MKIKSMRLGNFTEGEVAALYAQHTAETGQIFLESAVARAFALTAGQPWLVNALAHEIIDEMCIVLGTAVEGNIPAALKGRFALPDGRLDMDSLIRAFAEFWRENGEVLTGSLIYHEVAPQLVLMAFLQRIVNGGGFIDREYGLGRRRIDLLIRWLYEPDENDGQRQWQREAIELKVWRDKKPDPREEALLQFDAYLDRMELERGWLVIFDRRTNLPAGMPPAVERIGFEQAATPAGRAVAILRA